MTSLHLIVKEGLIIMFVKVERVNGESGTPASGFGDYKINVVSDNLNSVSVEELL